MFNPYVYVKCMFNLSLDTVMYWVKVVRRGTCLPPHSPSPVDKINQTCKLNSILDDPFSSK